MHGPANASVDLPGKNVSYHRAIGKKKKRRPLFFARQRASFMPPEKEEDSLFKVRAR
jgi:hypothetical protein